MSDIPPEKAAMAPFVQGWLAMEFQKQITAPDRMMKVKEVRIDTDAQGVLENTTVVVFESGAAIKVTIEPFDPDAEVNNAIRSIQGES